MPLLISWLNDIDMRDTKNIEKEYFLLEAGVDDYRITAKGFFVGKDLVVAIFGGTRPHVGAVAIAQPRPSLKNPDKISSTSSVFTLLGHKEDLLAKKIAEKLASEFNVTVTVTVGIHWDNLTPTGINKITEVSDKLIMRILDEIEII